MTTAWPRSDRQQALTQDLRILMSRGVSWLDAAQQLGVPQTTAYNWLRRAGVRL